MKKLTAALAILLLLLTSCQAAPKASRVTKLPEQNKGALEVLFINVGKGDAALIRYGSECYMIDTGDSSHCADVENALKAFNVNEITAMFITHDHDDHIGNMKAVSDIVKIGHIYGPSIYIPNKKGQNVVKNKAGRCDSEFSVLSAGDRIDIANGAYFEILAPIVKNEDDNNDNSMVIKLCANERTLLFCADMQFEEEQTLLDNSVDVRADIIKIGNHGNKDASSPSFLDLVKADYAIISTSRSEDANSANSRVIASLRGTDIFITEEAQTGILLSVSETSQINVYLLDKAL